MNHNLYALLRSRFPSDPSGSFLDTSKDVFSYADLERESAIYARLFLDAGLEKGDRVLVQVEKSAANVFIYAACLRYGLIYLPLNTAYQKNEIEYFVDNAKPSMIICDPGHQSNMRQLAESHGLDISILTLDAQGHGTISDQATNLAPYDFTDESQQDDIAVILYTSGTTGRPKGAMISHGNLTTNGLALHAAWGWRTDDVMLHALPIFHVHGLFLGLHLPMLSGAKIYFLQHFNTSKVISLFKDSTVYMGVPTNYTRLLSDPSLNTGSCCNMRLFTCGSAPLLEKTFYEFEQRTGHTILERYGMTETGMSTSNPLTGARKPGTVGPALPAVAAKVVDAEGRILPAGETGDLLVRGDNVFLGYWQMPDKTREEFSADGYFKTGDLATIDADGYVSIVGRSKDVIITGGFNVYPREVEAVIDKMPGVLESAVIGLPHADFGEAVTAIVVREKGSKVVADDIVNHLKQNLANFKVAKGVFFVDELPRNTMGKVQKNQLREGFSS